MKWFTAALLLSLSLSSYAKEKMSVKVIQREDNDTNYTYAIPSFTTGQSNTSANCYGNAANVNCTASTRSSGITTPGRSGSLSVRGATLSLLLPDGRTAVVNCESKYAPQGNHVNRRSCRSPLVNNIQAEFSGDKAKLEWVVSLDGKKTASETYKILAVFDKP
jgi:hypothetical protein